MMNIAIFVCPFMRNFTHRVAIELICIFLRNKESDILLQKSGTKKNKVISTYKDKKEIVQLVKRVLLTEEGLNKKNNIVY
jgi:hypothetical protein